MTDDAQAPSVTDGEAQEITPRYGLHPVRLEALFVVISISVGAAASHGGALLTCVGIGVLAFAISLILLAAIYRCYPVQRGAMLLMRFVIGR